MTSIVHIPPTPMVHLRLTMHLQLQGRALMLIVITIIREDLQVLKALVVAEERRAWALPSSVQGVAALLGMSLGAVYSGR